MEILMSLGMILLPLALATEVNETTSFLKTAESMTEPVYSENLTVKNSPLESNTERPLDGPETKEETADAEQPIAIAFPDNHKNFTDIQFPVEEIKFPFHNHLSDYQQQYKIYLQQKELYNRSPIKFQEEPIKNFYNYTRSGLDTGKNGFGHWIRENKKKPFPYVFEQSKDQNWYKNAVFDVVQVRPKTEPTWGGRQEVLQFQFPQEYIHEQKMHKSQPAIHVRDMAKKSKGSQWKKVFHLLTALVPLGLVLASLTPNVISVNSTSVTKNNRQRSEDMLETKLKEQDVADFMNEFGIESLTEAQCEDRLLCEMARRGNSSAAGPTEKRFWFLANETPWDDAERAGMIDLFKAIKTGTCESYKCYSYKKPNFKLEKKLRKKQKTKIR